MKKVYILGAVILLVISLLTLGLGPVMAQDNTAPSNIQMEVTINGLERGDEVVLCLSFETATTAEGLLLEQNVESDGKSITIDLRTSLEDGYYQLLLEAPDEYFRDPKGYFFQVYQSQIVNPSGRSIVFDLIPPSAQTFRPYRGSDLAAEVSDGGIPYMLERMISLSGPEKQPEPLQEETRDGTRGTRYYVGPVTTQDNLGLWGRFSVVNPGVRHTGGITEFVVDHVYINRWISGVQHWMEIGWAEVSWQSDTRYMYEYDSVDNTWNLYSLPTGSTLEVQLYNTGYSNYWFAGYKVSGYWAYFAYENLGFSTADAAYNRGEIYSSDGAAPQLPTATTTISKLNIGGSWVNWTSSYNTEFEDDYPPYDGYCVTEYTYFHIYSDED